MVVKIDRKIVKDIIDKINSIDKGVVFLYGESGSGKTYILETLNEIFDNGNLFKFEDYYGFDSKNSPLLIQIEEALNIKSDITNYNTIHAYQSKLDNIEQKTQIIFDNAQIREKFRSAFNKYNKPIIFLDAIENIIQGDRIFMEEMIDILVKKGVKVIASSRTLESIYSNNSFNITHFNQEEFDEFIKLNMPESNSHLNTIQILCITKDNYYNNITLSLMYSLYIEDKQDLFDLISDIKSELLNIFVVGNAHLKNDRFVSDMQEKILKKILGNNEILTSFILKVYLLKNISKSILDKMEIEYSQDEWDEYEKFIKINGSRIRNENREIEYSMHDNIFEILFSYFNNQISTICESEIIYLSLFKIVSFWIEERRLLKIELGKFINFIDLFLIIIKSKENIEIKNRIFFDLGSEFYELGYYNEAIENYEEAKRTIQELLKKNPENDSLKNDLASIYGSLGITFSRQGHYEKAIVNHKNAKIIREELLIINPNSDLFKRDLSKDYTNLGNALQGLGRYEEAIQIYENAKKIIQELLKKNPNNDILKNGLAKICVNLGIAFINIGNYEEANQNNENAKKIIQELLKKNPNNDILKNDLAIVYNNLGTVLIRMGKYEESNQNYEIAKQIREELLKKNPDNDLLKNYLAKTYMNLGISLSGLGKYEDADQNNEIAKISLQEILKKNPDNDSLKYDLACVYMSLGNTSEGMGKYEESNQNYEIAKQIREELLKKNPDNDSFKNDLASVYGSMGVIFSKELRYEDAIQNYKKAKKMREGILKTNLNNNSLKNDLTKDNVNLGNALQGLGRYEDAISNYEEAKISLQEILNNNPDNNLLNNNLAKIYEYLGFALQGLGRYEEAISNYEEAKKIRQELLKKNPDNDSLIKDLARVYGNLGLALYNISRYEEAIVNYNNGIDIYPKESGNFTNLFELYLIRNIQIDGNLKNLFIEYHGNSHKNMAIYDLLSLFNQVYNGQDYSILFQEWQEKYEGVKLDLGWTEIENWIEKENRDDLRQLLMKFKSISNNIIL